MISENERRKIKETHPWAKMAFVDEIIIKGKKEIEIIDSFYDIYEIYPEYFAISELFEEVNNESIKQILLKIKSIMKAAVVGSSSVIVAELMGMNMSASSFWGVLATVFGGSEVLYHANKKDLGLRFSTANKREILERFKTICDRFEETLNNYSYKVQDYVLTYSDEKNINWYETFREIVNKHYDYIEEKREKGEFDKRFNRVSIVNLHNLIFDKDEFNKALEEVKNSDKNDSDELRKRDK